jgi:hypothetical protein
MADRIKEALDKWSWSGGADNWNQVIAGTYGNILAFKRGQEVVDQMRGYNAQLGNLLTDDQLIAGLNQFSKEQFNHYGSGYAVDSDPFNIARWSVAKALFNVGAYDAGNALIAATDARQAITSQQAIEIGKAAVAQYQAADKQLRDMALVVGYGGGTTLGDFHMKDSFSDFILDATPMLMAAIVAPAFLGELGAAGTFGAEALTGEAVANTGFVDVLGGFTDATGTALAGWSEMAATTAVSSTATIADSGFVDALGGMTDSTGTALNTWAETATSTATTGATNVDTISDWLSSYSSDPGADPFATTEQVNAGWSYDGGYPGVDWYNSAGIGEASSATSLNDIFSNVSKALKSAGSILSGAQQLANGQNRVQPNLTRSAGQMNLALPLILGAAWFAFRG